MTKRLVWQLQAVAHGLQGHSVVEVGVAVSEYERIEKAAHRAHQSAGLCLIIICGTAMPHATKAQAQQRQCARQEHATGHGVLCAQRIRCRPGTDMGVKAAPLGLVLQLAVMAVAHHIRGKRAKGGSCGADRRPAAHPPGRLVRVGAVPVERLGNVGYGLVAIEISVERKAPVVDDAVEPRPSRCT